MTPNAPTHASLCLAQRGIVLLVCLSLGMHWALLQGIAWTGMLITFAREGAMIEAVEKTFDGQHACALCLKVKEGRESNREQPQQAGQSLKKLDAVLVAVVKLIAPAAKEMSFAVFREESVKRNERPEMPPPRRGLA
ncbi:MAG TPA: hypothetical protein PLB55_14065 [Prosthecobacter sp.]|nr:hypothetical protein [Prosthecobacter sp.]